jgi:hypothetical protein
MLQYQHASNSVYNPNPAFWLRAGTTGPARGSRRLRLLASLDQLALGVLQLSAELLGILVI